MNDLPCRLFDDDGIIIDDDVTIAVRILDRDRFGQRMQSHSRRHGNADPDVEFRVLEGFDALGLGMLVKHASVFVDPRRCLRRRLIDCRRRERYQDRCCDLRQEGLYRDDTFCCF